jgi:hypothetical protein
MDPVGAAVARSHAVSGVDAGQAIDLRTDPRRATPGRRSGRGFGVDGRDRRRGGGCALPSRGGHPLPAPLAGHQRRSPPRLSGLRVGDGRLRIRRKGCGRPRTRPGRVLGDTVFATGQSALPHSVRGSAPSPRRPHEHGAKYIEASTFGNIWLAQLICRCSCNFMRLKHVRAHSACIYATIRK